MDDDTRALIERAENMILGLDRLISFLKRSQVEPVEPDIKEIVERILDLPEPQRTMYMVGTFRAKEKSE